MMFGGSEYFVIIKYYSKMPIIQKSNTGLKELFAEFGILEEI